MGILSQGRGTPFYGVEHHPGTFPKEGASANALFGSEHVVSVTNGARTLLRIEVHQNFHSPEILN